MGFTTNDIYKCTVLLSSILPDAHMKLAWMMAMSALSSVTWMYSRAVVKMNVHMRHRQMHVALERILTHINADLVPSLKHALASRNLMLFSLLVYEPKCSFDDMRTQGLS